MHIPEETPLQALFGTHPQVKVIETLMLHSDFEYNLTELAESSEVSRSTVFGLRDKLLHYKIIRPTKKVGRIQLYTLDTKSPTGKLLNELSLRLVDTDVEQLVKEWEEEQKQKVLERE